jgi:hypothetical protein
MSRTGCAPCCCIILPMRKALPSHGVFALCALISFGTGCLVKSDRFVAGTYHAESPCATITLIVQRDHSFVQSVHTNAGGVNQLSGSWDRDEKGWITFRPFLDFPRMSTVSNWRQRSIGQYCYPEELCWAHSQLNAPSQTMRSTTSSNWGAYLIRHVNC